MRQDKSCGGKHGDGDAAHEPRPNRHAPIPGDEKHNAEDREQDLGQQFQSDVDLSVIGIPRLGKTILYIKTYTTLYGAERPITSAYMIATFLKKFAK